MTFNPLRVPVRRVRITLRLTRGVQLPAYHGHALHGLVTRALNIKPFPRTLVVRCVERGSFPRVEGSLYRFGVVGLGDGASLLIDARRKFAERGKTPHRGGRESLDGCFTIESYEEIGDVDLEALSHQLQAATGDVDLRFRTPVYLRRPRHNIRGGLSYVNRDDFPAVVLIEALARRALEVGQGTGSEESLAVLERSAPGAPRDVQLDASRLVNINFRYASETPNKPVEGSQGLLRVAGIPDEWLPYLVLGQYAQLGSSLGYGQGYYHIRRGSAGDDEWCTAATTLLDRALSSEMLAAAEQRVRDNADVRHNGWMPAEEPEDGAVDALTDAIRAGAYAPGALAGALVPKKGHGVRALAVPRAAERVIQRAIHDTLDADLDQLFEDSSYAYRKGRSIRQASLAIRRAQRRGFGWVLDADVTAFFDNVDWRTLGELLDAVLGDDPIRSVIAQSISAPVRLGGVEYARARGLPQGSPLSPILANLYLDALDEHLVTCGFAVVRYADDFVVLCRDPDDARRAKGEVMSELEHIGLTLNDEKTRIVSFNEGFHFLGLQFGGVPPTASETASPAATVETKPFNTADIPRGSWLAGVPFAVVQRLAESAYSHEVARSKNDRGKPRAPSMRREELSEGDSAGAQTAVNPRGGDWRGPHDKRPLFIVDLDARVMLRGEKICVLQGDGTTVEVPLRSVSHVTMLGPTRMTIPLVLRCVDLDIPVYFCRDSGLVRAAIAPSPDWNTVSRQLARSGDAEFCLDFARRVVQAKLHNAATLVVRLRLADSEIRGKEIRMLRDSCASAASVDEVLGFEGRGARVYFEAWAASLDSGWGFGARVKHPPTDPVNAMLSFTYTVLHQHVGAALIAAGVDPRIGLMHRQRGAHYALASDMQEEFRHLAESVVWSAIQHSRVGPGEFVATEGTPKTVRMSDETRRTMVRMVEERLFETFTPEGAERQTYRAFIDRQARSIAGVLRNSSGVYTPHRLHA